MSTIQGQIGTASGMVGDVTGPSSATNNAIVRFDGATGKYIRDSSVIIDDSGNITLPVLSTFDGRDISVDGSGIGVATPVSILEACEVAGGVFTLSRNDASITANDMIGKIQFYAPDTSSTTNKIVADIEAQATNTVTTDINPGRLIFRTTSTTVAATPTERMRIDEAGNVGIGVSPTYKLDVLGTTTRFGSTLAGDRADATLKVNYMVTPQYTNANTSFMAFGSSSGSSVNEVFYGGGSSSYNCATLLSFYTAANQTTVSGTERMRVNSSGDVGIGTSTVSARLHTLSTTEQLRVGYDASNYFSTTVGSTGGVTFDAVGSGAGFTFSDSITMADAKDIVINTTTGTKIGTSITQKIGFWNSTPAIQNTGWSVTGGYTSDKAFNPESTTATEVARVLGTLIDALKTYGILGA